MIKREKNFIVAQILVFEVHLVLSLLHLLPTFFSLRELIYKRTAYNTPVLSKESFLKFLAIVKQVGVSLIHLKYSTWTNPFWDQFVCHRITKWNRECLFFSNCFCLRLHRVQLHIHNSSELNRHSDYPVWLEKSRRLQLSRLVFFCWLATRLQRRLVLYIVKISFTWYRHSSILLSFLLQSALQSDSGNFLLNGGMIIGIGVREFRVEGAKVWYSGSDKATEQIKIDGKITKPIKVHVSNQCCFSRYYSNSVKR